MARQKFSITQPPMFETMPQINVPGNIEMANSVFANYPYLDPNTRGILQLIDYNDEDDYENVKPFVEAPDYRNIFQKGMDFYRESPGARLGIGALLGGGPLGALVSLFAPKILDSVSDGIGSIFGPRVDMNKVTEGIQSNVDDDSQEGISSFDAAVSAGIQAAEDDI